MQNQSSILRVSGTYHIVAITHSLTSIELGYLLNPLLDSLNWIAGVIARHGKFKE